MMNRRPNGEGRHQKFGGWLVERFGLALKLVACMCCVSVGAGGAIELFVIGDVVLDDQRRGGQFFFETREPRGVWTETSTLIYWSHLVAGRVTFGSIIGVFALVLCAWVTFDPERAGRD